MSGRFPPPSAETACRLHPLSRRRFECIVGSEGLAGEWLSRLAEIKGDRAFVGVEGGQDAARDFPDVQFVAGRRDQLPALLRGGRPVLLLEEPGERPELPGNIPLLLGHIEASPMPS